MKIVKKYMIGDFSPFRSDLWFDVNTSHYDLPRFNTWYDFVTLNEITTLVRSNPKVSLRRLKHR